MSQQLHESPSMPLMIGGAGAVLLVGAVVVTMLAWVPEEANAGAVIAPVGVARDSHDNPVPMKCPECAIVTSAKRIGSAGPAAGGYAVTVRMRDGSQRSFTDVDNSRWRAGNRMIVIGGAEPRGEE